MAKGNAQQPETPHEGTPGMTVMTLIYNVLFLALYLFYFYMVWKRWKVS